MPDVKIAPSILSADFERINEEISQVEQESQFIHVDVMDGKFVPPTTPLTSEYVSMISTPVPLDVHLMVQEPSNEYLQGYIDAGAASITVHVEACKDPKEQISYIKQQGCKAGIAIKPNTPVLDIISYLDIVDMVLVMTVEPGWAGQKFMKGMKAKIAEIRSLKPDIDIEVDGGIDPKTAPVTKKAGANVFVAGSAIFGKEDRLEATRELRLSVE